MEIERKFLVANDSWKKQVVSRSEIMQFYLTGKEQFPSVRLRICDGQGFLTIKYTSSSQSALAREEFEYPIPREDVELQRHAATGSVIEKIRYHVKGPDQKMWEVDVFSSPVDDLVLAEIELEEVNEAFERPAWLGKEVTQDHRYSNLSLSFKTL